MATIYDPLPDGPATLRDAVSIIEALVGWVGPADALERPRHDFNINHLVFQSERHPGSHLTAQIGKNP